MPAKFGSNLLSTFPGLQRNSISADIAMPEPQREGAGPLDEAPSTKLVEVGADALMLFHCCVASSAPLKMTEAVLKQDDGDVCEKSWWI